MGTSRRKLVDHGNPTPAKRRRQNGPSAVPAFTLRRTQTGRLGQRREAVEEANADRSEESLEGQEEPVGTEEGGNWQDVEDGVGGDAASQTEAPSTGARYNTKSNGKGTIHVKLKHWLPRRQTYLDEILRHNGRLYTGGSNLCRECNVAEGDVKCRDCFVRGLLCSECTVKNHNNLPFHRVELWNGDFFDKTSLRALGLRVQLGHDGLECTRPKPAHPEFVVMDTQGFHLVAFDFCNCGGAPPHFVQLLRSGLFPASTDRPRTAFTFDVLDTFHELTLQGKTNMYDFFRSMLRRTCNAKPATTYKYNEFTFIVRLWRHLTMLKRAGRGQDPRGVDATSQGELAVECPACPQPGRNLPPDWQNAPTDRKWLYKLFLAVDANFKLKLKDRGFKDIELAPGWVYFVEEETYQRVIGSIIEEVETNSCRSQHNAIVAANIRNVLGYQTNGAGAVVCGRHSLVRRNGVADLSKGEKYASMDYIVLSTLIKTTVSELLVSYDIGCQWSKNFPTRLKNFPERMHLDIDNINMRTVVPKFHLPAHGVSCQTRFSLNFIPQVGRTYGEGVESEWAHINGTATSTREMAPAVRHEVLNDHWSSWNWQKWLDFGSYFIRKLREALKWRAAHKEYYISLTKSVPGGTIAKWEAMIRAWNEDQTKPDPYEEPVIEMTLNDVRLEFAKEDAAEAREGLQMQHAVSRRAFVSIGIDLEERQRAFRFRAKSKDLRTSASAASNQESRNALYRQIMQWRAAQDIYMPGVAARRKQAAMSSKEPVEDRPSGATVVDVAIDGAIISAENLDLNLPLAAPELASKDLQLKEGRLRVAQADDALETIRRLRRIITGVSAFKTLQVNGTCNKPNTRMHTLFQRYQAKIKLAVDRYRRSRQALLALDEDLVKELDPEGEWKERFLDLTDNDVRGPGRDDDRQKRTGEGRVVPSWIWAQARPNLDGSLGEFGESVRVEWAKAKARVERWEEEILLLCEEMRRVLAFLAWKAEDWLSRRGKRVDLHEDMRNGVDAYAAKQAAVLRRLAFDFARAWIPFLRQLSPVPDWAQTYELNIPPTSPRPPEDVLGVLAARAARHVYRGGRRGHVVIAIRPNPDYEEPAPVYAERPESSGDTGVDCASATTTARLHDIEDFGTVMEPVKDVTSAVGLKASVSTPIRGSSTSRGLSSGSSVTGELDPDAREPVLNGEAPEITGSGGTSTGLEHGSRTMERLDSNARAFGGPGGDLNAFGGLNSSTSASRGLSSAAGASRGFDIRTRNSTSTYDVTGEPSRGLSATEEFIAGASGIGKLHNDSDTMDGLRDSSGMMEGLRIDSGALGGPHINSRATGGPDLSVRELSRQDVSSSAAQELSVNTLALESVNGASRLTELSNGSSATGGLDSGTKLDDNLSSKLFESWTARNRDNGGSLSDDNISLISFDDECESDDEFEYEDLL